MSRLTTAAVILALLASPVLPVTIATAAHAETAPSVLDTMCGVHSHGLPCTVMVQRESGEEVLKVRDPAGVVHRFFSSASAYRYLHHRVPSCRLTGGNACLGHHGVDRYIVIGYGSTHDRSLPQYGHGTLVYLGELD